MNQKQETAQPNIEEKRNRIRHSAAHILAEAVMELFPDAHPAIGPPTSDGFYYDFALPHTFTPEDLERIEELMRASISANSAFIETQVNREDALQSVKGNPYKVDILNSIPEGEPITIVTHSDGAFTDLCRGGHVERTGDVKALKLLTSAGAYWRGDSRNPMLQRIYGTAWENISSLEEHLHKLQEAKKRDHRILGRELNLFFFDPTAPASPFFLPKGAIIFNALIEYVRELYKTSGYVEVITPQIFDCELWKRSGHYDYYADNMFFVKSDEREFGVKPMNCPAAALIYKAEHKSYRDLPLRLADFGRLHRYEKSGVTHGLTRVRSFSQDDAHIFCTREQIPEEITNFLDSVQSSYAIFGLHNPRFTLSTKPEHRVGDDRTWVETEEILENVLLKTKLPFVKEEGEGAFYGPKIDVFVPDAIQREWQLGTIQLDFSLPERFDLEYTATDGTRQRPIVIHRAMLGSIERFTGILLEHLEGHLPLWLSPIQTVIIPIADRHNDYAAQILKQLKSVDIRSTLDTSNIRMNAKIRNARLLRVPYMLIIGDREIETDTAALRSHTKGNEGSMTIPEIIVRLKKEITERIVNPHK